MADDIKTIDEELVTASKMLEWELGDIWGHVGARIPGEEAIALKLFRPAAEAPDEDWLIHFDYDLNTLEGIGTPPLEARIYTEVFKARPDVNAAIHSHAPMCVAMSLAGNTVTGGHMQAMEFGMGLPVYPKTIFIVDADEGADLARTLGDAPAVLIRGHGVVVVGESIDKVTVTAMRLERAAKTQAFARMMGFQGTDEETLQAYSESQHKLQEQARAYGSKQATAAHSPEWTYYAQKIKKGELWNRGLG